MLREIRSGRVAAGTPFPAVGSAAKLFVNFARKHVLRRFPFQVGRLRSQESWSQTFQGMPELGSRSAPASSRLLGPRVWSVCCGLTMGHVPRAERSGALLRRLRAPFTLTPVLPSSGKVASSHSEKGSARPVWRIQFKSFPHTPGPRLR